MSTVVSRLVHLSRKYPLSRGMLAYATVWPLSSLCQQMVAGKEVDYTQVLRFFLFGSCFVAPSLHAWLRLSTVWWPQRTLKAAVTKALVEQVSYGPAACACFFFGMSLLEGADVHDAAQEVRAKFLPTYKVGACVWPVLQTVNFVLVPERNRVVYVCVCSFVWSSFLAYMKQLQAKSLLQTDHILSVATQHPVS